MKKSLYLFSVLVILSFLLLATVLTPNSIPSPNIVSVDNMVVLEEFDTIGTTPISIEVRNLYSETHTYPGDKIKITTPAAYYRMFDSPEELPEIEFINSKLSVISSSATKRSISTQVLVPFIGLMQFEEYRPYFSGPYSNQIFIFIPENIGTEMVLSDYRKN